jgi:membrane fusion protein, multidrug efflux system
MKRIAFILAACLYAITVQVHADDQLQQGQIKLGLSASGIVSTVEVTTGQQVKKGQVLLKLDQSAIKARQAAARAYHEQKKLEFAEATREYERNQDLYDRTQLSQHELQMAEIAWKTSKAELAEAEARLAQCRLQLEYSQLRAPVDGSVREVMAWPGMAVANELQITPLIIMAPHPPASR